MKSRNYAWSIALACVVHACAADPPLSLHGWVNVAPEEVGIDSAPLGEMIDFARERRIAVHSVQIVRSGKLAFDAYFYPYDGTTRHDVASVTKSVTSILVGLAIERGQISNVQQSARELALGRGAQGERPNVEDLLTMRSGWDCGFEPKYGLDAIHVRSAQSRRTRPRMRYCKQS